MKKVYRLPLPSLTRAGFASKVDASYGTHSPKGYNFEWGSTCWCCKYIRVKVSEL